MAKSRTFSIYLLKQGFTEANSLKEDHVLEADVEASNLPAGAQIFVLDSAPRPPWWRSYFGIAKDLNQVSKGALVFLPVGARHFALSFGHVSHNLLEASFEHDFGLRVTLNCLDPHKLKSTDTLDPGVSKRQRTQLPVEAELTLFDFDRDSTILRSLTGKVKGEYEDLFRHATGGSNLRISSDIGPNELVELCEELLTLYGGDQYKEAFPEIQNITPVRDPARIAALNAKLITAFGEKSPDVNITVPEIINYDDNLYITFSGAGRSEIYDDVYIGRYYDYLEKNEVALTAIGINELSRHALVLTDEDGNGRNKFSIFKSLVFDTVLDGVANETFHMCEGNWYRVEDAYIDRLKEFLDPLFTASDLPPYKHQSEGEYNLSVAAADSKIACLDTKNISPDGQTAVEPCDLLTIRNGKASFYHIKVSTLSAQLSHLFNQGTNAIELMRLESRAVDKLETLIRAGLAESDADELVALVRGRKDRVVFGIVTKKDPAGLSWNLPLFSRISLMRIMKYLLLMGVPGSVMFISDQLTPTEGRKKKRKSNAAATPEAGVTESETAEATQ